MTDAHREGLLGALAELRTSSASKDDLQLPTVELLDPHGHNVSDPYGGQLADYEFAAGNIERAMAERVLEWI